MSGEKKWLFRIEDMLEAITELQKHLKTVSEEQFLSDAFIQKATERYFEILGEAARFIPKEAQIEYSSIPWAEIIGMRHKISHDYLDVNPLVLWRSYQNDLSPLKEQLQLMLKQEDQ
jgi:uncharacterized protein with HEPN domain